MNGRSVLVTGGGGFVGAHLATGLAAIGARVTALDLAFDDTTRARLAGIERVTLDLARDPLPGIAPDLVVHAAAVTAPPEALGLSAVAHMRANLEPLLAVLEAAANWRAGVVFLSSSGVFAPGDGRGRLADDAAPTAVHPYAAAKRAGEVLALAAGPPAWVLRLGHLYGPHEAPRPTRPAVSLVARWLAAARTGGTLAVPADDPARDWTFAPDLAPAIARLVAADPPGRPVHLASPHILRDSDLAALIAARHRAARIETGPPAATKPPMVASALAPLAGFAWTAPEDGLAALDRESVA
jgi:UDP-glucose 4-epimerase